MKLKIKELFERIRKALKPSMKSIPIAVWFSCLSTLSPENQVRWNSSTCWIL